MSRAALPDYALLQKYAQTDAYTDCYTTSIAGNHTHAAYVTAFYTTWLFKLERIILRWLVAKPSTDSDARNVAEGRTDTFATWRVEQRKHNQLLMCDFRQRTRSWFMTQSFGTDDEPKTRLYFGSAVVADPLSDPGDAGIGWGFQLLLGFHKLYSRALLASTRRRMESR